MAAEFDMDTGIDGELDAEFDAELEADLDARMDELLFDQKEYDKLPNSLAELEKLKAALPEKQRAESQRIKQARADLQKEVEAFKANITMPEDLEKILARRMKIGRILTIGGILLFLLGPLTQNIDFWYSCHWRRYHYVYIKRRRGKRRGQS